MWRKSVLAAAAVLVLTVGCIESETTPERASRQVQDATLTRAFQAMPAVPPDQFPARAAINASMAETARPGEWYTYSLNFDGQPIFYVVSEFAPMSLCDSISATDYVDHANSEGRVLRKAPSLDGIYRAG